MTFLGVIASSIRKTAIPLAHKYWRARWLSTADDRFRVDELKMYETVGGVDLTVSGTALESSHNGTDAAALAFDKIDNTAWVSLSGSQGTLARGAYWLGYSFSTPVKVTAIDVKVPSTNFIQGPLSGMMQWSDDGTTWTDAFALEFNSWTASQTQSVNVASTYNPRLTKLGKMVVVKQVAPVLVKIEKMVIVKAL